MSITKGFGIIMEDHEVRIARLESKQNRTNILIVVLFVLLILSFVVPARASEMSQEEIVVKEIIWEVLHVLDWGTTLDIAKQPERYYETNPILGEHPSVDAVNFYMGGWAILHPIITHWLPNRDIYVRNFKFNPKRAWLNTSIFVSGTCVINNFSVGLKIAF